MAKKQVAKADEFSETPAPDPVATRYVVQPNEKGEGFEWDGVVYMPGDTFELPPKWRVEKDIVGRDVFAYDILGDIRQPDGSTRREVIDTKHIYLPIKAS